MRNKSLFCEMKFDIRKDNIWYSWFMQYDKVFLLRFCKILLMMMKYWTPISFYSIIYNDGTL